MHTYIDTKPHSTATLSSDKSPSLISYFSFVEFTVYIASLHHYLPVSSTFIQLKKHLYN